MSNNIEIKLALIDKFTYSHALEMPEEVQLALAKDSEKEVRRALVTCSFLTEEVQLILLNDKEEVFVRDYFLEYCECISKPLQLSFCRHPNAKIRIAIARNEYIEDDIKKILSQDDNEDVRKSLASCFTNPEFIQWILVKDESYQVRAELARSNVMENNLVEEIQYMLLKDSHPEVRENLCYGFTKREIKLQLTNDLEECVRRAAISNLDTTRARYWINPKLF